jgi:hypothetical protein
VRTSHTALVIVALGVLTFGIVFSLLEFSPSRAEPDQPVPAEPPTPTAVAIASDSLAPSVAAGNLAIGVPIAGSEALLRNVQPGDRLDIVASLTPPRTGTPFTTVLIRGATVVRTPLSNDPLLVQVAAPDAVMLAHVILRGTHLGYILWPASGSLPAATPPAVDDRTARAALGLAQPTTPPLPPSVPAPTLAPAPVPTFSGGPESGFLYQVQPNDTWDSIAGIFGVPVAELRQWNEALNDTEPVPGRLVFIPRAS